MYKLKSNIFKVLCIVVLSCTNYVRYANAEPLIVTSQKALFTNIDSNIARKLWMGKKKRISGLKVKIIDQVDGNEVQSEFYQKLLGKSSDEMKAYWAKLVFTGGIFPPRKLKDDSKIKDWLVKHPDSIGYIDSSSLDDTVRVLLKIK